MYCITIWASSLFFYQFLLRVCILVLAYCPFLFHFLHKPVLMYWNCPMWDEYSVWNWIELKGCPAADRCLQLIGVHVSSASLTYWRLLSKCSAVTFVRPVTRLSPKTWAIEPQSLQGGGGANILSCHWYCRHRNDSLEPTSSWVTVDAEMKAPPPPPRAEILQQSKVVSVKLR